MTKLKKSSDQDVLRQKARYFEVIQEFALFQMGLNSLEDILWNVTETAISQLGFVDCVIYLLDDAGTNLIQMAAHGPKNPTSREILNSIKIPVGEGIVGTVASTGEIERISDTRKDPRYIMDDAPRLSELAVPIIHQKKVIGVLDCEHDELNFFTDEHIQLLSTIVSLVSNRIDTALAIRKFESTVGQLQSSERNLERKATELQKVALELTQLIDTANAPIFSVDTEGRIDEWNQMVGNITGFVKDEVMGQDLVKQIINKDQRETVKAVLKNALRGIQTRSYEVPLNTKDGRPIIMLLNAATRFNAEGIINGVVGVGQDITELTAYRENLERMVNSRTRDLNQSVQDTEKTRDRIDAILSSVPDGLIVTDTNNRVILMNRVSEELLGVRFSDVIDRPINFAIAEKTLCEKVKDTLGTKSSGYQFDFELPGKVLKKLKIMRAQTSVFYSRDGKQSGVVTILRDVTLEREVDRMKTEFISTVAHELRTPLTSIMGFSEILLTRNNFKPQERKKFLTYVNKQARDLASIINDLLDISSIESGQSFRLNKSSCNAGDVIRNLIPHYQMHHSEHRIEVTLPEEPVELLADIEKLGQVLKNLISNAVNYSPAGGLILVAGEVSGDQFQVSVEDQGLGMTPAVQKNIFNRFYRGDASDTAIHGLGLGLTIVKYIVEAHGGKIWIESEYGLGTIVRFNIPI